jgi:hypothetical protein
MEGTGRPAGMRRERIDMFDSSITALNGPTPKAVLLLLCARIGYTPHENIQR